MKSEPKSVFVSVFVTLVENPRGHQAGRIGKAMIMMMMMMNMYRETS